MNRTRRAAKRTNFNVQVHRPPPVPTQPEFWVGPYGMLVPTSVTSVISEDGGNRIYRDGHLTNAYVDPQKKISKYRYLGLYADAGRDGRWYFSASKSIGE